MLCCLYPPFSSSSCSTMLGPGQNGKRKWVIVEVSHDMQTKKEKDEPDSMPKLCWATRVAAEAGAATMPLVAECQVPSNKDCWGSKSMFGFWIRNIKYTPDRTNNSWKRGVCRRSGMVGSIIYTCSTGHNIIDIWQLKTIITDNNKQQHS